MAPGCLRPSAVSFEFDIKLAHDRAELQEGGAPARGRILENGNRKVCVWGVGVGVGVGGVGGEDEKRWPPYLSIRVTIGKTTKNKRRKKRKWSRGPPSPATPPNSHPVDFWRRGWAGRSAQNGPKIDLPFAYSLSRFEGRPALPYFTYEQQPVEPTIF